MRAVGRRGLPPPTGAVDGPGPDRHPTFLWGRKRALAISGLGAKLASRQNGSEALLVGRPGFRGLTTPNLKMSSRILDAEKIEK